jgi:hypothetical protein
MIVLEGFDYGYRHFALRQPFTFFKRRSLRKCGAGAKNDSKQRNYQ